jgi:hypothetical protein
MRFVIGYRGCRIYGEKSSLVFVMSALSSLACAQGLAGILRSARHGKQSLK